MKVIWQSNTGISSMLAILMLRKFWQQEWDTHALLLSKQDTKFAIIFLILEMQQDFLQYLKT